MHINDKILITGGSGFIGTNLIEFLFLKGFKNIVNFDFNKPKIPTHLPYWVNIDIRNKFQLKDEFKRINPNYIIHLAARTDLLGKSIDDYSSNTIGTKNLIDLSILYKPKFFVHTSTRLVILMVLNQQTMLFITQILFMERVNLFQRVTSKM